MTFTRKVIRYVFEVIVLLVAVGSGYFFYEKYQQAKKEEKPTEIVVGKEFKLVQSAEYKGNELFIVYKNDTAINIISINPNTK